MPQQSRLRKLFTEGFSALDIAEPLRSFDGDRAAVEVRELMSDEGLEAVGVRVDGEIAGYLDRVAVALDAEAKGAEPGAFDGVSCDQLVRGFEEGSLLEDSASLQQVMEALDRHGICFITVLERPAGVIGRSDILKPPVRMWLFGLITIIEMQMGRLLEERFPEGSWQKLLSRGRLQRALAVLEERTRRNQLARLSDCLQLTDKAHILMKDPAIIADSGFPSKKQAQRAVKELESLRNNLAHGQDILTYDWEGVVELSRRLDRILSRV